MSDRARLSRLETFSSQDNGASFLGSKDFPNALINACKKYDPKGILFGTKDIINPIPPEDQERIRPLLDSRVARKRFQVLSGGVDKLVPYKASAPFLTLLKHAAATWYKDGGIYVEDNIYQSAGHMFSDDMRSDAVRFVLDSVALQDGGKELTPSKI